MSQQPPAYPPAGPPPPPPPAGRPAVGIRPGGVTAAAVVLIILGVIYALFGVIAAIGGGAVGDLLGGAFAGAVIAIGIVVVIFGVLEVIAGIRILGLSQGWRIGGIVLASIGAVFSLISLIGAFSGQQEFDFETGQITQGGINAGSLIFALIFLAANLFVIIQLARSRAAFTA